MTGKLLLSIVFLIGFSSFIIAQELDLERLLEQQQDRSEISDLMEMLAEMEQHPIDLNQATAEQLAVLPWISDILAIAIINYRDQIGSFEAIDELTRVENVNPDLIPILRKYLTVSSPKANRNFSLTTKIRLSRKIQPNEIVQDISYYTATTKAYHRLNLSYGNNLRLGLLLEKDSGEPRIDDLRVYFLSYRNNTNQNKLIIGNYRLEFAQGLVFGNPYGYYKGGHVSYPATTNRRELLEYSLVDENASLYGISGKFCFKIYQFFIFLSSTQLDATLTDDGKIKNFYSSGYHRNNLEMDKKDRVNERLVGSRILIKPVANFSLGATYYRSYFDRYAAIQDNNLYRFGFRGKTNELIGIDYKLTLSQFNWFGELARSKNNGFGLLTGMLMQSQNLEIVIMGRNYSKNFISFYGNSFGERADNPQNEQGIYFGFQLKPFRNLQFEVYFDQFKFPWRSYFIPMPSNGKDLFISVEHKAIRNLILSIQYRFEQKEEYTSELKYIIPRNQNRLRVQLEFQPVTDMRLRCRVEKKWVNYQYYKQVPSRYPDDFQGILLYQDLFLKLNHNLDIAARFTLFDSDNYESRLYQFESDVPGMLTNQMLYGMGSRGYVRIQWKIKKILNLSIKYGSTQYHYVPLNSSDSDTKTGKTLNSITLQLETNW